MNFANFNIITFSIFLIFSLLILFFFYFFIKNQINFNKNFKLLSTKKYFYIKYCFLIISFFIVLFSIFGLNKIIKRDYNQGKGIDIVFVVDVSKSMNVADIENSNYSYTRLDMVKKSISNFVVSNRNNRFGLVIFAGEAVSTVPLTTDSDLFLTFLEGIDYRKLTKQGSDFEKAISLGVDRFNISGDGQTALIFISDGGDQDYIISEKEIKNISEKEDQINYFVVGVGTEEGGKIIIGKDVFDRNLYQKYKGGYVRSRINRENLKNISSYLNGEYFELSKIGDLLNLNKSIEKIKKKNIEKNNTKNRKDLSRFLSFISFIFFIMFFILYIVED